MLERTANLYLDLSRFSAGTVSGKGPHCAYGVREAGHLRISEINVKFASKIAHYRSQDFAVASVSQVLLEWFKFGVEIENLLIGNVAAFALSSGRKYPRMPDSQSMRVP